MRKLVNRNLIQLYIRRYDYGGALEWIKKHHPEVRYKKEVAKAMDKYSQKYASPKTADWVKYRYAYDAISVGKGNIFDNGLIYGKSDSGARKHYLELLDLGMDKNVAFEIAFPPVDRRLNDIKSPVHDIGRYRKQAAARMNLYYELVVKPYQNTTINNTPALSKASNTAAQKSNVEAQKSNTEIQNSSVEEPQNLRGSNKKDIVVDDAQLSVSNLEKKEESPVKPSVFTPLEETDKREFIPSVINKPVELTTTTTNQYRLVPKTPPVSRPDNMPLMNRGDVRYTISDVTGNSPYFSSDIELVNSLANTSDKNMFKLALMNRLGMSSWDSTTALNRLNYLGIKGHIGGSDRKRLRNLINKGTTVEGKIRN